MYLERSDEVVHEMEGLPTKLPKDAGGVITLYAEEQNVFAKISNVKTNDDGGDDGGVAADGGRGRSTSEARRRSSLHLEVSSSTNTQLPSTLPAPLPEVSETKTKVGPGLKQLREQNEKLKAEIEAMQAGNTLKEREMAGELEALREQATELKRQMESIKKSLKG
mmetsp:Transcript_17142/g.44567  ORF Transcript_17142/g.44567 Transcript_17142/m.44567 type:complete len:165 (-) Transcript_17142:138-632(-)